MLARVGLRRIMAGNIQCIGTSTPATFANLQADRHWLAEYFEPIEVAPANEEIAIKVLQGIKGAYEKFHNVSYTDGAIAHAVHCAEKYIKNKSLPGTAVDIIDEAGAAAELEQGSLPRRLSRFRSAFVSSCSEWRLLSRITNLRKLAFIHRKSARSVTT